MKLAIWRRAGSMNYTALAQRLKTYEEQFHDASAFVTAIELGNFNHEISSKLKETALGDALSSMKEHLARLSATEEKRNWMNSGLAAFSDILRNKNSLSLKALADEILLHLVKYIEANQGALFVLEENDGEQDLNLVACYAYERKKYIDRRIAIGEGLVGQCFLEKESVYLKEVPAGYANITSGLGEAKPKSVFICPLKVNDVIYGIVELASLSELEPHKLEFVEKLSESIGSTIKGVKDSEQTIRLLNASQQQAAELREQEEEMRQNVEEMTATQEEMKRKSDELAQATAEMSGVIRGIDATMATIEFQPDGTIMKANANFLSTMKVRMTDIVGKHHRMFVPGEVRESIEYRNFWARLGRGEALNGTFKRMSSDGKVVWLNAIYNPIRDANGNVVKVVKFATDITVQQEMHAQTEGLLSGIDATMATIEFTPSGTITSANENFLKTMNYSLAEIQGKHHQLFVPIEMINSTAYKQFWNDLASGRSTTGTFERVNRLGEKVVLKAIYNPIKDSTGKVVKVIKFATTVSSSEILSVVR